MGKHKQNNDAPGIVKVRFNNDKAGQMFISWLSQSGENDYWEYMKSMELEEKGHITATKFTYSLNQLTVNTECGRLDEPVAKLQMKKSNL